jgi:Mrp family chromosome partitioning ATPase
MDGTWPISAQLPKTDSRGDTVLNSTLIADREPNFAFQGILHSVFQRLESGEGIAIAFTSANSGEGVSYVSHQISSQLALSGSGSALYLSSADVCNQSWMRGPKYFDASPKDQEVPSRTSWEDWRGKVTRLRALHQYSIIDCPALSASSDVLSLAPHVDGVVVVVAANETHKSQIANVERQVRMVNGKILGYVLNKRKYMVPDWLYKRL